MENMPIELPIEVHSAIYIKDPRSSELGRRIVSGSVDFIHAHGFEQFTFKKLAKEIGSTEASVYRYFESKHKVLLYLVSWYWTWMEYRLVLAMANIEDPRDMLNRALLVLTEKVETDGNVVHINETKLQDVVISESSKTYLNRKVDEENSEGVFKVYKRLVERVAQVVHKINPRYKYPHMLISTCIEAAHFQRFFADHLPRLTDVVEGEDSVTQCLKELVLRTIEPR